MKKLKILHVSPYYYPAWAYGGIPRVVYELSRETARLGHDVTVCTTDVLDSQHRYLEAGRLELDGVATRYFKNLSNRLAYDLQVYLPFGLNKFLSKEMCRFDIVHLHGHRHFLNNIAVRHARKHGIPYVMSGHGTVVRIERRVLAKILFDKIFGQSVLDGARKFVAVSESEVAQYAEFGISKDKVEVIYNGIDASAFSVLPEKGRFRKRYGLEGKKLALYLGKITPRKGIDVFLSSLKYLCGGEVAVVAGSDMGFKVELDKIVRNEGFEERVLFTGLLTGEEKLAAYVDADVVVYPAVHEIFGLVPFEAMLCGTPVVVTDDCGCGEIIGREGIGYTVRYGDPRALAEKITEVMNDRVGSGMRVKKGVEFIKASLGWSGIAQRHIELYVNAMR